MPGFLTHYLFGIETSDSLSENYIQHVIRENNHAFLLGIQGSDLLSFNPHALSRRGLSYRTAAQSLQNQEYAAFFNHMLDCIEGMESKDKDICAAYMAGYLCYYTIDLFAAPYIIYRVWQDLPPGCRMSRMNAHKADIETVIDIVLLRSHCHMEPSQLNINALTFAGKHEISIISHILYDTIQRTYKYTISKKEISTGIRQIRRSSIYLRPDSRYRRLWCDLFVRSGPASAISRKKVYEDFQPDNEDFMNREKHPWYPYAGCPQAQHSSFDELYTGALLAARTLLESFDSCVSWGMDREDFINSIIRMTPYL